MRSADIRGEQLGRRTRVDHGFVGDTKTTLRGLLPKLKQAADDKHLKSALEHYRKAREALDELAIEGREGRGSHPQFVARELDELAEADAIFSCDVGTPTIWAARYRRADDSPGTPGDFNVGRWRSRHAHGRFAFASATGVACQSDRLQKRRARLCRTGNESSGDPRIRNGSAQSGFREDRGGGRAPRSDG